MLKNHIACILLMLLTLGGYAHGHNHESKTLAFSENKGQWHENVQYRAELHSGNLYLEKNGFTYSFYDKSFLAKYHAERETFKMPESIDAHSVKIKFLNSNPTVTLSGKDRTNDYKNYFLGNDTTKWASYVYGYRDVDYSDLYDFIDLSIYEEKGYLKYDFIVDPGANVYNIELQYEGADDLYLKDGNLVVKTSITDITEQKPYAYQIIDGKRKQVPCKFVLNGNKLSYKFPRGYNKTERLIIDPILIFSSFTGSTADNFGFTATYDFAGFTYVGGIVYAGGIYPTTAGSYQVNFNGTTTSTTIDIGISKFDVTGSSLVYSTYLGGTGSEAPHSLVVNDNNELFILGTSGSPDFPTTANAFSPGFSGGTQVSPPSSGVNFFAGSDIIVAKLSASGANLIGSTYVGGSSNDGLNTGANLAYNYGDPFRGEIIVDANGNCIVASTTTSSDFPLAGNSPQPVFGGGGYDGVIFKMNANLSSMIWGTFWGGDSQDSGFGVQLNSSGDMYMTGGTMSSNLTATGGALNQANSGSVDGYIVRFSSNGNVVLAATYIGTAAHDETYFVQVDQNNDVYVIGQTEGSYPVTPASVYNNANSGQFIHKLDPNLTSTIFSTVVGTGSGTVDFSPSAFLVNNCGHIYISGWGGPLNATYLAPNSTTIGLPTTANAFQQATDGSDFYLMVLDVDASALIYGTFFGGPVSREHVDGGTSRFDKNGVVYQAVCAGCGGNSDFPTTPGTWSNTNNSSNCNLGVFKFDLNEIHALANFNVTTPLCTTPANVDFNNLSSGAVEYWWDYGDNTTSIGFNGQHTYDEPGTYIVSLVAIDSQTCMVADTFQMTVTIPFPPITEVSDPDTVCAGFPIQLNASGGITYSWAPSGSLNNPNIPDPIANPQATTEYVVTISDSIGCTTTDTVIGYVHPPPSLEAGADIILNFGDDNLSFNASVPGNSTFFWTPPEGLSCTDCLNPIVFPEDNMTYYLIVTDEFGCTAIDSVQVFLTSTIYAPNAFTPNIDGKNDVFYIEGTGINTIEIFIFNRWGELIYESDDMSEGWDGTYEGLKAQLDVYVWMVKYTDFINPDEVRKKVGHVTLVR
jgi:gliding motility-associated-like protein